MTAIWVLAGSIIWLAITIIAVACCWVAGAGNRLETLDDEEIARRLAPCVAAELIIMQAQEQHEDGEGSVA